MLDEGTRSLSEEMAARVYEKNRVEPDRTTR